MYLWGFNVILPTEEIMLPRFLIFPAFSDKEDACII